jgi:hypothetical protein
VEEGEEVSILGRWVTFQPEASRGQGREEVKEARKTGDLESQGR